MADKTDVLLQIKVDEKSIKDVKSTIKNVKKDIEKESISVVSSKQTSEIAKQTQEYEKLISKVKIFKDQQERTLKTLQSGKYGGFVDSKEIAKFKSELDSLSATTPNLSTRMKEVDNQLKNIKTNAVLAGTGVQSFTKDITHGITKMAEWGIAGGILFGTLNKIGESIKFITELDTAFANIRMASGLTRDDTAGLASEYNNLAKELGVSTKVIANSAVELYRQGLSTQEAKAQLQDYIKFAKVLGRDLQSTIELGTAGTTTYSVSVEKLGSIATSVGDAVASSGDEVLQIIQKSGSSAQVAGVQLEELATIGALMASTTRESGSQIGNSLKNIFSKLSQVDDLTGEINDDYGKTLKRISSLGIEIEDGNGNLLDAMQILKNVGGQWDELSVQQQKYLASGFGIYQLNRFSAAVKAVSGNSQEYNDLLKVAYESTGQLDKKYEEYSNSVEASNERLKASWEDLYINVLDSGMIQSTIGLGTAFIDLLNKTNAVQVAMVALGVVISVNMYRGFMSLTVVIAESIAMMKAFGVAATISLINPVALAAVSIGVLVGALIAVSKHMEEAERASINMANSVSSNNTQVTALVSSITDLNGTQELNEQQQLRLQQTYDELLKIYPELENLVDRNTLSYDSLTEATLKASNAQKQLAQEAINAQKASLTALLASEKAMQEKRKSSATTSKPIPGFAGFSQADLIPVADANIAKIEKQLKDLSKAEAELNKTAITKSTFTPTVKADGDGVKYTPTDDKKSPSSSSKKQSDILDNFRKQISLVTELSSALNILKTKSDLAEGDDKIKAQNKVVSGYKNQQNALNLYSKSIRDYIKTHKVSQEDLDKLNDILRQNGEQWWSIQSAIKGVKKEQDDYNKKTLEETKKSLEDSLKSQQSALEKLIDTNSKAIELELDKAELALENYNKSIEDQEELNKLKEIDNEITEANIEYQKELKKLTDERQNILNNKNTRMLNAQGTAFELVANPEDLQANADKISDLTTNYTDKIADLNTKRSEEVKAQAIKTRQEELKADIDTQKKRIEALKTFNSEVKSAIELGGVDGKLALDTALTNLLASDQSFFATRIAGYQGMVASINAELSKISAIDTSLGNNTTTSSGSNTTTSKSNQQKYLENLKSSGTSGQKKWAEAQLNAGKYHDGMEGGLVGGLPIPKNYEQLALLAKGEMVLNQPQMNNLSNFINSTISKGSSAIGSAGNIIINSLTLPSVTNGDNFVKELQRIRITNS